MQYRVTGVHPTGLTVARGVGRCSQYVVCIVFAVLSDSYRRRQFIVHPHCCRDSHAGGHMRELWFGIETLYWQFCEVTADIITVLMRLTVPGIDCLWD